MERLQNENSVMRSELKKVNHALNVFLEHVSAYNMKKRTIAQFDVVGDDSKLMLMSGRRS